MNRFLLKIAYLLLFFGGKVEAKDWFQQKLSLDSFQSKDALCFKSAESSFNLGAVRNCILLFEEGNSQFWLMKQDIQYDKGNVANLIGIVVDVSKDPRKAKSTASYFEFDRTKFEDAGVLQPQAYKVPCLMCHSSGPRAIRPYSQDSLYPESKIDLAKLEVWNQKIAALKQVDYAKPNSQQEGKLQLSDARSQIPLNIVACTECHSKSGIREPLTYMQQNSITFLTGNHPTAAMPPKGHSISKVDQDCLDKWLEHPFPEKCGDEKVSEDRILNSFLSVKVETTFHDFKMKPLKASISKTCNESICTVTGKINLATLDSGIESRNMTIRGIFDADKFPDMEFTGKMPNRESYKGTIAVQLMIRGIPYTQSVAISCDADLTQCLLGETKIDLSHWNINIPKPFGIGVTKIVVSGLFRSQ